jgi:sugar-specific transcriptional regulator TrmB
LARGRTQVKQDVGRISQERIVEGIVSLGLSQSEAEVYVYLAKHGPQKAKAIAEALKMQEQIIYRSLQSLKSREIVNATPERPTEFCAIPFDRALELLVKAHLKESQNIEQEKDEILSQWQSIVTEHRRLPNRLR